MAWQIAKTQSGAKTGQGAPSWALPVLVITVILAVVLVGRKRREAVENPVVDLIIITFGVFAFAALFRVVALKLNNPGAASFFGAPTPSTTTPITS